MSRLWCVRVYGFDGNPFDPVVEADTPGVARYAAFKEIREAGYFDGQDGFRRFLSNVSVRLASPGEELCARRIGRPRLHPALDPLSTSTRGSDG